eukprot:2120579-Rhodomonas_salina.5
MAERVAEAGHVDQQQQTLQVWPSSAPENHYPVLTHPLPILHNPVARALRSVSSSRACTDAVVLVLLVLTSGVTLCPARAVADWLWLCLLQRQQPMDDPGASRPPSLSSAVPAVSAQPTEDAESIRAVWFDLVL